MRFWERAAFDRSRVALVDANGDEHTAGALLDAANRAVGLLRSHGVGRGDTVAMLLPNCAELFQLYLAAMQAGSYLTPINHHLTGGEVAHILRDSDAKVLLAHERFAPTVHDALAELDGPPVVFTAGTARGDGSWHAALAAQAAETPADRTLGGIMYYTSGTTGRPKGVRRALLDGSPDESAGMYSELLRLCGIAASDADVHLCTSPLYHTAVLAFATDALHGGQRVVLMDRWDAADALELIERHGVTNTHMVPTQFHRLLALPADVRDAADVSSLRYVLHGAAPCPVEVKQRMIAWWGPVIVEYYGTTEGGGTVVTSGEWLERPGTVGRPWPGAEIRILDERVDTAGDRDVPPAPAGQPGVVYIRLGDEPFEYHGDPAKTAGGRRGDFFTVGDIGYLDDGGYLFLCDRIADVIISGGVNIYPAEIEGVLLAHDDVADVAVVGAIDDARGERVVAVVEPRNGTPHPVLEAALRDHCTRRLARFKIPTEFRFVDTLPRDPNGKLPRRQVRDAVRGEDVTRG